MSLKGLRRDLRAKNTYRTRALVQTIENVIWCWLDANIVFITPDNGNGGLNIPGTELIDSNGNGTGIMEVGRTPRELVWDLGDDAFARYIVHCCARWYEIISFSKPFLFLNACG